MYHGDMAKDIINDKHVNYFALQKACDKPGCPICDIVNERIDRYIDGMLFEHISDRVFRAQYREAGGFCNRHSEALLSYRDGLAVAILGQGEISEKIEDFKKKKMRKYKMPCPACAEQDRIENEFLRFMAESGKLDETDEKEMVSFVTKGDGLCVPHYAKLVQLMGRKVPKWLSSFQEDKFRKLLERTDRFIDFSAWGKQKQFETLPPEDKVVWKELAANLRGSIK